MLLVTLIQQPVQPQQLMLNFTGTPSITVATVAAAVVNTTGDVSIGGSLTVNGDMTTINSVELNIEDKLVGIASVPSPLILDVMVQDFKFLERQIKLLLGKETLVALSTVNQISLKV